MGLFKRVVALAAEGRSAGEIAVEVGTTTEWVERVMGADGFKEAMAEYQGAGWEKRDE